jgi:hypothetical protein
MSCARRVVPRSTLVVCLSHRCISVSTNQTKRTKQTIDCTETVFGDDIVVFLTAPSADAWLHLGFLICFFFFLVDLVFRSSLNRKYIYSFMWWLDVMAAASIIPDVPLLSGWIVDLFQLDASVTASEEEMSLARVGRAARAGTRVGRIMKLMKVFRLVRMMKLFQQVKGNSIVYTVPVGEETPQSASTHVGSKIAGLIETKVIFGVMVSKLPQLSCSFVQTFRLCFNAFDSHDMQSGLVVRHI